MHVCMHMCMCFNVYVCVCTHMCSNKHIHIDKVNLKPLGEGIWQYQWREGRKPEL